MVQFLFQLFTKLVVENDILEIVNSINSSNITRALCQNVETFIMNL